MQLKYWAHNLTVISYNDKWAAYANSAIASGMPYTIMYAKDLMTSVPEAGI